MSGDDVALWPNGDWCYRDGLSGMTHLSDDYQILVFNSPEWRKFIEEEES